MRSMFKYAAFGVVVAGATMVMTTHVISQEQGYDQEAMEKMVEMARTPGPEHARMAKLAGKWKQNSRHWDHLAPSSEPSVNTNYAEFKSIIGGRYMVEKLKGTMNWHGKENEFEALGIFGFDNMRQKHFFIWLDNFGTGYMLGEGEADESGDVITYYTEMEWGGENVKFKSVSTTINDDETAFEMYVQTPEGWWKNMELEAQRVKKGY